MLHEETVAPATIDLIKRLSADKMLNDFVLVGGTALALQLGHRRSIDIDLFASSEVDTKKIGAHLKSVYQIGDMAIIKNGIFTWIEGVKLDMLSKVPNWINPPLLIDGVRMASLDDIAASKLHAIVQSGARLKDFIDMYFLFEHRSLEGMLNTYEKKYPESSPSIARNALLHHADINFTWDTSVLIRPFDWKEINARLRRAVFSAKMVFTPEPPRKIPSQQQQTKKQNRRKR